MTKIQLYAKLVVSFLISTVTIVFSTIAITTHTNEELKGNEIEAIIDSIKSGPLQFARYQSTQLANQQLKLLLESRTLYPGLVLSAQIKDTSPEQNVFASWSSGVLVPQKCILEKKNTEQFDDGIVGFEISVLVDDCKGSLERDQVWILGTVIITTFLFCLSIFLFVLLPVGTSINHASEIIRTGKRVSLNNIKYTPLKKLANYALKSIENEKEIAREKMSFEKNRAIAISAQMLAHDVRKPFTLVSALIEMVSTAKKTDQVKKLLKESIPDILGSLSSVNGMIQDVMEIGENNSELMTSKESLTELVHETLSTIFRFHPKSKIDIEFTKKHQQKLLVNRLKVGRVFANIIANAVEHMKEEGKIWIETKKQGDMVEICLGNSNTYIPIEDRKQLFEAFFTKGKQGGTGLGLAIAKKLVEAHGGKIWCESSQNKGTEFYFTLPLSDEIDDSKIQILKSSQEYYYAGVPKINLEESTTDKHGNSEADAEEAIIEYNLNLNIKNELKIAIVDDEAIYRRHLKSHIENSKGLLSQCKIVEYGTSEDALGAIGNELTFDIVILDVDLGRGQPSGFDVIPQLRKTCPNSKICIHSNRGALEYHSQALKAGADLFLPKPMPRLHLLKILASAIGLNDDDMRLDPQNDKYPFIGKLIVVEDNKTLAQAWRTLYNDPNMISVFTKFKDFVDASENGQLENGVKAILTDYFLDAKKTGVDVAKIAGKIAPELPVYLCSNADEVDVTIFAGVLPKMPLKALEALIGKKEEAPD